MQGLARNVFLGDLTLEFDAVGAVLSHGFHPWKPGKFRSIPNLQSVHRLGCTPVHSPNQFESAFAAMMQERPDALSVTVDAFHMSHVGWIIDFAAKHRLPTMYIVRDNVAAGGLISYGPSIGDLYHRGASYGHKILQGA